MGWHADFLKPPSPSPHWFHQPSFTHKKLNNISRHDVATTVGIRKVRVTRRIRINSPGVYACVKERESEGGINKIKT